MNIIKGTIYRGLLAIALLTGAMPLAAFAAGGPAGQNFTVVIDAGHGGHDTGAVDNGVREKDINLGVAKKLAEKIGKKMKNLDVVMTRDNDKFISLQERANIANSKRGNLFISIHTNSVDKSNPNRKTVAGASVYALGLHKDASNLKVAQRENSVIELESDYKQKYSGFNPQKDESYIIFEMAQKKNLGQSLKFANEAQKHLVSDAGRVDKGVKQAGFWVLWATSMPAVLVELDFICNPTAASFIGSEKGQEKLADALYNALESYIESTPGLKVDVKNDSKKSSPASKKKDSKKKSNRRGVNKAEDRAEEVPVTVVESSSDDLDIPVVVAATARTRENRVTKSGDKPREERSYNYASVHKRTLPVGQRKRRGAASRRASDQRNVTGQEIVLKSENDYLAKTEAKPVMNTKVVAQADDDVKNAKKKKNKKNNKDKNKVQKQTAKKNSDGGKKRIVVSSQGDVATMDSKDKSKTKITVQPAKRHTSLAGKNNRN